MRGHGLAIPAVVLGLLCAPSWARAELSISGFRESAEGLMEGTVTASGYGQCEGAPDMGGCFGTYLYGYIRVDDGSCPLEEGNLAVFANLPRDGSTVTEAVDGDPAVRGQNRLCVYIERLYWSGAKAVIAQASAVAPSSGPAQDVEGGDGVALGPEPDADYPGGTGQRAGDSRPKSLRLSAREARRQVKRVLRRVFKRSFNEHSLSRSCRRRTRAKVACNVAWSRRTLRFEGKVVVRKALGGYRYALRIHRSGPCGGTRLVRRSGALEPYPRRRGPSR